MYSYRASWLGKESFAPHIAVVAGTLCNSVLAYFVFFVLVLDWLLFLEHTTPGKIGVIVPSNET